MLPELAAHYDDLRTRLSEKPALAPFDLAARARPSIRLTTRRVPNAELEIGASRIGGLPDVPPGFEWPRWEPSEERLRRNSYFSTPLPGSRLPLAFIAQIDLASLPRVDDSLPSSGWLWFFYERLVEPWGFDPGDRGSARVLYAEGDRGALDRIVPPDDADLDTVAAPCALAASVELTLPDPDSVEGLEYDTPAWRAYAELADRRLNESVHRLLGHPQLIQNPMERECQLASNGIYCGGTNYYPVEEVERLEPGAADWRLLLQIDTDEEGPGWMWGDGGRIYFWIRQQDLAARRFENAWLIFQCS